MSYGPLTGPWGCPTLADLGLPYWLGVPCALAGTPTCLGNWIPLPGLVLSSEALVGGMAFVLTWDSGSKPWNPGSQVGEGDLLISSLQGIVQFLLRWLHSVPVLILDPPPLSPAHLPRNEPVACGGDGEQPLPRRGLSLKVRPWHLGWGE